MWPDQLAILAALCISIAFLAGMFAYSEYIRIIRNRDQHQQEG